MSRPLLAFAIALSFATTFPNASAADDGKLAEFIEAQNQFRELRGHKNIPVPNRQDIEDALAGEMVVKKGDVNDQGLRFVWAAKIMNVPAKDYWFTIIDREHYDQISENIVESFTYKPRLDGFLTYNALEAPLVSTRHQVLDATVNKNLFEASEGKVWEHYWGLVPDASAEVDHALTLNRLETLAIEDLKKAVVIAHNRGTWMLIPLPDGRTWAETYTINDPGGKIPDFVVRKVSAMATGRTLEAYETWAKNQVPSHINAEHVEIMAPTGKFIQPLDFERALTATAAPVTQAAK